MDYLENPILITGCARSRTSLIAGIVNLSGAFGGFLAPANANNKKGMFENTTIRNALCKPFLQSIGADPMGQSPLPSMNKFVNLSYAFIKSWRARVIDVITAQGYDETTPWFYKGAKMCLMWPVWYSAFPDAQWIIVRRNDDDIADSCLRTPFMRAYKTREGWLEWVSEHKKRFDEMKLNKLNIIEIWSDKIIHRDYEEVKNAVRTLGLYWDEERVNEFVSPELTYLGERSEKDAKNNIG